MDLGLKSKRVPITGGANVIVDGAITARVQY